MIRAKMRSYKLFSKQIDFNFSFEFYNHHHHHHHPNYSIKNHQIKEKSNPKFKNNLRWSIAKKLQMIPILSHESKIEKHQSRIRGPPVAEVPFSASLSLHLLSSRQEVVPLSPRRASRIYPAWLRTPHRSPNNARFVSVRSAFYPGRVFFESALPLFFFFYPSSPDGSMLSPLPLFLRHAVIDGITVVARFPFHSLLRCKTFCNYIPSVIRVHNVKN